jgi:hypothetical protein
MLEVVSIKEKISVCKITDGVDASALEKNMIVTLKNNESPDRNIIP